MDILQEYTSDDLYMRYAVDGSPDDKDFKMHIHDNFEVFYFISGNAGYLVEGSEYSLEPGNILIMRPSESHRAKILNGEKYERYAINFSAELISCIDPSGYQNRFTKDRWGEGIFIIQQA